MSTEDTGVRFAAESIVSARTREGLVRITLGEASTVCDLKKAREIRGLLDGAIEAAVSDELMVRFLMGDVVGLTLEQATLALREFRIMRQGSPDVVYPH